MTRADSSGPEPPKIPKVRPGRVGGKRDANRRRVTANICDAALALFLEHGVEPVTIDQIVARAGIAKGSFYRYFKDKTQLVETILAPLAEGFDAATSATEKAVEGATRPGDMPAIYVALAQAIGRAVDDNRDCLQLYLQEARSPARGSAKPVRELADRVTERAIALSRGARDRGLLRDTDPVVGSLLVIGAAERLLWSYLAGEELGPVEKIPGELVSLILEGVGRR